MADENKPIELNDIVIMNDPSLKRNQWPIPSDLASDLRDRIINFEIQNYCLGMKKLICFWIQDYKFVFLSLSHLLWSLRV